MHGGDVVDANDRGAAVKPSATAASVPASRSGPPQRQRADEVLARHGQQDRPAEGHDGFEMGQHVDRLGGRLGEIRAGVEHDAVDVDPDSIAVAMRSRRNATTSATTSS